MTPSTKRWGGVNRRTTLAWDGKNRRRPTPKKVHWGPSWIGVLLIAAGITVHIVLRERFDVVPIALIIMGGAMIDKDAIRAASRMFSIRRGNGSTGEYPQQGDM